MGIYFTPDNWDSRYMEDFNVVLKQPDGTELVVNTSLIDEDVLRMRCGLELKEQD